MPLDVFWEWRYHYFFAQQLGVFVVKDNIRNVVRHSVPLIKVVEAVSNAATNIVVRARAHAVALKRKESNAAIRRIVRIGVTKSGNIKRNGVTKKMKVARNPMTLKLVKKKRECLKKNNFFNVENGICDYLAVDAVEGQFLIDSGCEKRQFNII